MNVAGFCPQCNSLLNQENYSTGHAICGCGWFDKAVVEQATKRYEKRAISYMAAAVIVMALGFGHMLNWGAYAFSIPLIKVQKITGTLSKEGYHELAQACIAMNKWSCAKDTYIDLYKRTGDSSSLKDLAHLQTLLKDPKAAMSTYASYFQVGGRDGEAALEYAGLLEVQGYLPDAYKYYEFSIAARPETLPVEATKGIVRMLIKEGRYNEARERILAFHESAGNAKGFLNTELSQLDHHFGKSSKKKSS